MKATLLDSYAFCDALARREAKNFYYSFRLLPPDRRRSMCALYAFMRQTDDLADEPGETPAKAEGLKRWRSDLADALDGRADAWPGLLALADTVTRHALPAKYLYEVIDGVEMDLTPRVYETFDDLYGYCYRVASAVGLCCLSIWGYRSEGGRAQAMAEACGIALQLTNILRDVGEDARNGRVYLPQEELARYKVGPDELKGTVMTDGLHALFAAQARRAYAYYEEAGPLVMLVAPIGRPVLLAIEGIYRALLDEIARREYDVLSSKVSLPGWRKAAIALGALPSRFGRPILAESPS
jgi:15-cis-phytoene synthase